jgi:hypothetical protein
LFVNVCLYDTICRCCCCCWFGCISICRYVDMSIVSCCFCVVYVRLAHDRFRIHSRMYNFICFCMEVVLNNGLFTFIVCCILKESSWVDTWTWQRGILSQIYIYIYIYIYQDYIKSIEIQNVKTKVWKVDLNARFFQ